MPEKSSRRKKDAVKKLPLKALAPENDGALHTGDTVETAGDRLRGHHADLWPVAEGRKLVGVVNEENPDWKIGGHGHDPQDWKVGEIMSRDVVFCYDDEDCATAGRLMEERGLRFLPVVDHQMRIIGIFSREHIEEKAGRLPSEELLIYET
jgi:CBS domain-containing protein